MKNTQVIHWNENNTRKSVPNNMLLIFYLFTSSSNKIFSVTRKYLRSQLTIKFSFVRKIELYSIFSTLGLFLSQSNTHFLSVSLCICLCVSVSLCICLCLSSFCLCLTVSPLSASVSLCFFSLSLCVPSHCLSVFLLTVSLCFFSMSLCVSSHRVSVTLSLPLCLSVCLSLSLSFYRLHLSVSISPLSLPAVASCRKKF